MDLKVLVRWLRAVIIGVAVCGAVAYGVVCPVCGMKIIEDHPDVSGWFWPWLGFILITAIPCYVVLFYCWKIVGNIASGRAFSYNNARYFSVMSYLALGDVAFFFVGNVVLLLVNMNHPSVIVASLLIVFVGIAVAVVFATLSHLVKKAADLQQENDLTV
ncbi:MAG: DUF2975 domain-containing protein [Oscillospiraceae bacterium]|nr:DUF2975 domain-containing protein [Ruminococcus sp.]MCD8344794.1 DUF2975 domain-containing protein [Oscillospiraceae bacterium]